MKNIHLQDALGQVSRWSVVALTVGTIALEANLAQAITFTPSPNTPAPSRSTGGASRSNTFIPRNNRAPKATTGGASRGAIFKPTSGRRISQTVGGASRGAMFKPTGRVLRATGGASRGKLFASSSAPKQTAGGASRDATTYVNPIEDSQYPAALMALVPQEFSGTTLSDRPSILVYLPESNAEEAVFSLKDEVGQLIYQTVLPISGEAGVVRVQLPESVAPLAVGKNYQWLTALKVDGRLSPSTPYVDGWIQRIATTPEMAQALNKSDAITRAEALANAGIWYDSAATLAVLREQQPDHEASLKNWQALLTSVGLQSIQNAPMLQYQ
jgi:hypothetical protein